MEEKIELENYFDEYENVYVDGMQYEMMTPAENYIYNGEEDEKDYLNRIRKELKVIIEALKKQKALVHYDVEYYNAQYKTTGSARLKKEYIMSSYKYSLIASKLNYYIGIKESIDDLLGKGRELRK